MKKPHLNPIGKVTDRFSVPTMGVCAMLVASTALVACAGSQAPDGHQPWGCPAVSVLQDVERIDATANDGSAVGVSFRSLPGECLYTTGDVTVDVDATLQAERQSGSGGEARVQYFVAVVDPDEVILNKRVFETEVPMDGVFGTRREQLRQVIPLSDLGAGPDYQVILGFQP